MSEWFLIALVAPFLWSIVTLLDVYLVDQVYEEAHDGTVVAGLLQGCVVLLVPFVGFAWPGSIAALLLLSGGVAFIASFHWYFKSMFLVGDSPMIYIVWNFTVPLVPIFAWILAGESLSVANYIGIALIFIGGTSLGWDKSIRKEDFFSTWRSMLPAVFLFALGMVLQKKGYESMPTEDFWSGFILFSIGAVLGGLIALISHKRLKEFSSRIMGLGQKYLFLFLSTEGMSILGTVASQKAISMAPGVSLVAAIESLIPLFVILNSLPVAFMLRNHALGAVYRKQANGFRGKAVAIVLMAVGIYYVA